ncbi:MAG: iron-containing alcohol dehydrogenase [bacterium]
MHPDLFQFDFHPTTRVIFGENALARLGELAKASGAKRILLVTDPGLIASGHVDKARQSLAQENLTCFVFDEVKENPTTAHVAQGVAYTRENFPIDLIIALGGGSVMDCAKGINFLLTNGGKMEDYWGFGKATKPMLPSVGIPTTAGTGSEAQSYALIVQPDTHRKMACGDVKARFRIVILDPALLASVPRKVASVTGIDAIAHAVESYVSLRANPVSRMFSKEAWRLLSKNFIPSLQNSGNLSILAEMLLGSHFAGHAIENSMLGGAHACANPLTAKYGLPHGLAVGLMLPHIIRFNDSCAGEKYFDLFEDTSSTNSAQAGGEKLAGKIEEFLTSADFPPRLRDCSVEKRDLPALAHAAMQEWTGRFNPRALTDEESLQLYAAAY